MIAGMTLICIILCLLLFGFYLGIRFGMFIDKIAEDKLYKMVPDRKEKSNEECIQEFIDYL